MRLELTWDRALITDFGGGGGLKKKIVFSCCHGNMPTLIILII